MSEIMQKLCEEHFERLGKIDSRSRLEKLHHSKRRNLIDHENDLFEKQVGEACGYEVGETY